jgi:hypothetical protein
LRGKNELTPDLIAEWNYKKNKKKPDEVSKYSNKKVWWICKENHEWQAYVCNRSRGSGCPYCSGRKVKEGFNDLKTMKPELLSEWNYKRNVDISPNEVSPNSSVSVWWICKYGHEWKTRIITRNSGCKCPVCMGKKICVGFNDLYTTNPSIAKEWHPNKNGDLTPYDVSRGSTKKVWWKCNNCGYEWRTSINSRTYHNYMCPNCKGKRDK